MAGTGTGIVEQGGVVGVIDTERRRGRGTTTKKESSDGAGPGTDVVIRGRLLGGGD